ncbi:hypothetical protein AOLI_G00029500 [Acnodon oligacanthus]
MCERPGCWGDISARLPVKATAFRTLNRTAADLHQLLQPQDFFSVWISRVPPAVDLLRIFSSIRPSQASPSTQPSSSAQGSSSNGPVPRSVRAPARGG